jgi:hypothetical protein
MKIIPKVEKRGKTPPSPMKFNEIWLWVEDFRKLIKGYWLHLEA